MPRHTIFIGGMVVILGLFWPIWLHISTIWLTGGDHHQGLVVIPIVGWLVFKHHPISSKQTSLPNLFRSTDAHMAALILCAGLAIMAAGWRTDIRLLQHLSLPILMIGLFILAFGRNAARARRIPLALLFFMVPVGDGLLPLTQELTTRGIIAGFALTDYSITRDGFLLATDAGRFQVGEACSGIRFLVSALFVAMLFGYLRLQKTRNIIAFIVLAAGLAVVANLGRAFLMVWIATITDMQVATGVDHLWFGWAIYMIMITIILTIGALWRQREYRSLPSGERPS